MWNGVAPLDERHQASDACLGPPARHSRSPLARYGSWLILIWAPLLLGAYVIAAAQERQWRDMVLLLSACAAFAVSIVSVYRPPPLRRLTPPAWAPLGLLAALVVIMVATVRTVPASELAFMGVALVAIATAVVLPSRVAPAVVVLIGCAAAITGLVAGWGWGLASWLGVTTVLSGMGTFVMHYLTATIRELDATRVQLAEAAVSAERQRFSRDLHDLLGHTLSVVVVKAEAVRRLAETDPAAAAAHGAEIETLGRSALTEVRQAVAGYREGGLEDEISRAAAALRAGEIRPDIGHVPHGLDPGAERQLAWAVREATTNVLQHSGATTCRIQVELDPGWARVTVADDGHSTPERMPTGSVPTGHRGSRTGTGLTGLRERLAERGGTVTVERRPEGFTLAAEVPHATTRSPQAADAGRRGRQEHP